MEVKPTFFSISGFLVPGVVLLALITALSLGNQYASINEAIKATPSLPESNGTAFLAGTTIGVIFLAFSFVIGTILSDLFILVGRKMILRPLTRNMLRRNVERVFKHESLENLIKADMDARESYVYLHTCGIDLHWYAGRIRMMGGTGFAFIICFIYSWALSYSCVVTLSLLFFGAIAIGISLYRSYKFDQYISGAAEMLKQGGGSDGTQIKAEI
ncbi:MAG: hypothetical protein ABW158_20550 [Candidatus Thiodiazotropha sp. 6PDIVS]